MTIHLDFETYSSVPIGSAGAQAYFRSPDFEILLCAYSIDGSPVLLLDLTTHEGRDYFDNTLGPLLLASDTILVAYNAAFEAGCIAQHFHLGSFTPAYAAKFRCAMLHGLYAGYTAGLDATGKALGLPADKQKLAVGKSLIRYFCVPCKATKANGGRTRNLPKHDPEKWALFKDYCIQDVVTEMEIDRRLCRMTKQSGTTLQMMLWHRFGRRQRPAGKSAKNCTSPTNWRKWVGKSRKNTARCRYRRA